MYGAAGRFASTHATSSGPTYAGSAPVEPGVVYAFDTGHCGLDFLTDFDGSFWMPINPDGTGDPSVFLYNRDVGAIVLADAEHAWYRSSDGRIVTLERVEGPVTTYPCA